MSRDNPLAAVVAVPQYKGGYEPLPHAKAAAERLAGILAAGGYALASADLLGGGTMAVLNANLQEWIGAAPDKSVLVLYWTGHGEVVGSGHFLICEDSSKPPAQNIIDTGSIGRMIAQSRAEKALVIINTCFSGGGGIGIGNAFNDLDRNFPAVAGRMRALSVITSTNALDKADETLFIDCLTEILTTPASDLSWTDNSAFIKPDELSDALNVRMQAKGDFQVKYYATGHGFDFLRNPRFTPNLPAQSVEKAVERTSPDAVTSAAAFTGRVAVLDKLGYWLRQPQGTLKILTGSPGAGKSAIVQKVTGRWDELGDHASVAMPFDAVIRAKGLNADQLVRQLGQKLDIAIPSLSIDYADFADRAGALGRPVRIAVDGLDEAAPGQASIIARNVLRPLSEQPNTWLLLGTRRRIDGTVGDEGADRHKQLKELFGDSVKALDLADESDAHTDIADYVAASLQGLSNRASPAKIRDMAQKVADEAAGNFLFANVVSRSLLLNPELDFEALKGDALKAFDEDLTARYSPEQVAALRDLLSALAWSRGSGLPRSLWPKFATALSGNSYSDADITWLLQNAAWQVVETHAETGGIQQTVYRLFHQAVAEAYRKRWPLEQEANIASTLTRDLFGDNWFDVDPYLQRHLAGHLASAKMLDDFLPNIYFLSIVEPASLVALLDGVGGDIPRFAAGVYRRAADRLAELPPIERMPLIDLVSRMNMAQRQWTPSSRRLFGDLSPLVGWETVEASTRASTEHTVHVRSSIAVRAMSLLATEGGPWIILGLEGGSLEFYQVQDPDNAWTAEELHWNRICSIAIAEGPSGPLVASVGGDSRIVIYDPVARDQVEATHVHTRWYEHWMLEGGTGHSDDWPSISAVLGRPNIIVAGPFDDALYAFDVDSLFPWTPQSLDPIGPAIPAQSHVAHFAAALVDLRLVVFVGSRDMLRCYDLVTGQQIGKEWSPHPADITVVEIVSTPSGPVIVTGHADGAITRWRAGERTPAGKPFSADGAVSGISFRSRGDDLDFIIAVNDRMIMYNWEGSRISESFVGHSGPILGAGVAVDDPQRLISAGADATVRYWSLAGVGDMPNGQWNQFEISAWFGKSIPPTHNPLPGAFAPEMAIPEAWGCSAKELAYDASHDLTALCRTGNDSIDLFSGLSKVWSVTTGGEPIGRMSFCELDGHVLLAARLSEKVRVWDVTARRRYGDIPIDRQCDAEDCVLVTVEGRLHVIYTVDEECIVQSLDTGNTSSIFWRLGEKPIFETANIGGEQILIVTSVLHTVFGILTHLNGHPFFKSHDLSSSTRAAAMRIGSGPLGPHVFVGSATGTLYRLDPRNGARLNRIAIGAPIDDIRCPQAMKSIFLCRLSKVQS